MRAVIAKPQNPGSNLNSPLRLGELLLRAGLVSEAQVEVAVYDQACHTGMRFGEILSLRGWLKPETAEFFVEQWPNLLHQAHRLWLGEYFKSAALLSSDQVERVCCEQRQTGLRFGSAAVLLGLIKQPTLDFFLIHLFPEERLAGARMKKRPVPPQDKASVAQQRLTLDSKATLTQAKTTRVQPPDDEVKWIG